MSFSGRIYINRLTSYCVSYYGILLIRRKTEDYQSITFHVIKFLTNCETLFKLESFDEFIRKCIK